MANLLLLDKDPLQAVRAWNSISTVILHGTPIERQSLAAQNRQTPAPQAE